MRSRFARLWSKDRRRAKRHAALPLVAYYWGAVSSEPHQVRDIGVDGMYLATEDRWYPNTLIKMTLTRNDKAKVEPDRSIAVTARVLRAGPTESDLRLFCRLRCKPSMPTATSTSKRI
jgi:hypothetical protein